MPDRQHGIDDGHCAAISVVQRSGDGLRLDPHAHSLFADGVRRTSLGTFARLFQPQDLIAKVVALLPAPGANLLRLHGQFAPGARWRAHVVAGQARAQGATPPKGEEQRQRRIAWSALLRRSLAVDALACSACGGRRELLAVIEHKATVEKILRHLGLESELPGFAPATGLPPLPGLLGDEPGPDDVGARRVVVDPEFVEPDDG